MARPTWRSCRSSLIVLALATGLAGCAVAARNALQQDAQSLRAAQDASARCASLVARKVNAGAVEGAEWFAAGSTLTGGETAGAKVSQDLCRVRLRLSSAPGSDIKAEVWLPVRWNEKLFALGGAGFDGSLNAEGGAKQLDKLAGQGYAALASDAGHKPARSLEPWVHKQPQRIADFGHLGNHLATVAAKEVITGYYGSAAERSYFMGCSNGGRDGIMEASRYPGDYDAILAGAPARRYLEIVTQLIWYSRSTVGEGAVPNLQSKLDLVHRAVLRQCDELDGVKDGILENPQLCRFDPAQLRCEGGDGAGCLTEAEVGALRKVYGGLRLKDGQSIISGPALGSEGAQDNWSSWIVTGMGAEAGQEIYRWMVFDDPKWSVEAFDFERDYPLAKSRLASVLNADDADLRPFLRRGGKLLMYQGWNDPVVVPSETIDYYEAVVRKGGAAAQSQVRLFMVPGMTHCAGGPGANTFDMQPVLEAWAEGGRAPERVIATGSREAGQAPLSRPLCAWPKSARYKASGSTDDAANYDCRAPS